tara:strand:+ start:251 stop:865 length:615 start_codon:yes stop_codon:yes gene_type:complete
MSKKPLIIFEGIEGSGKTYHIKEIRKYLKRKKIAYLSLREPGGTLNSEKIRRLILDKNSKFKKNTDLLLYLAARSENIDFLKKNINKKVILIDRFTDSTIAYQHYGFGVNLDLIKYINKFLLKGIKPNFTFLNIVNSKNMKLRLQNRKKLNRYDKFDLKFYNKVQKGFIKLAMKNKKHYKIIDSNKSINENKKIVIEQINNLIR